MYEVFLHMQLSMNPEKLAWILYHENKSKLTKWIMQKCAS